MSKRLGGIIGCKYKTFSWHLNGFPDGSNIGSTICMYMVRIYDHHNLPKCVMFGEMVGGAGCGGGQEKERMGCFLDYLRVFGINADQWTTAAQDEGEWRRTAENKGRNISWRNRSLQRNPRLDYGMQWYART